ncbi:hypothetical protein QU845_25325, partial [Escherichia coli]|nr:hypothetical protein [Escherichia coli]
SCSGTARHHPASPHYCGYRSTPYPTVGPARTSASARSIPAYSNNPAWCLWDMLTHPRYGMGKRLGAADVDKWALYVIGQY